MNNTTTIEILARYLLYIHYIYIVAKIFFAQKRIYFLRSQTCIIVNLLILAIELGNYATS